MKPFRALLHALTLIAVSLSASCAVSAQDRAAFPHSETQATGSVVSVQDLKIPAAAQREFEKGRKLFLKNHKDGESIAALRKAIRLAPSFMLAHYLLGSIYLENSKWEDAEPELKTAIALNGQFGYAYLALGSCLFKQGRLDEAEPALLQGNELSPNVPQGNYELARTFLALGRFQEAEPIARKSVALNSSFPDGHLVLGFVLLRLQKNQEAFDELQTFLRLAPDSPDSQHAKEALDGLAQVLTVMK
jgi:tetratricopeptide (TPR) repeat protein